MTTPHVHVVHILYSSGKSDKFDEWRAIRQSFPFQSFPVNTFPMKNTIKVLLVKVSDMLDSSDFFTIKILRHTVLDECVAL